MKHNHTFGCPLVTLQNALAADSKLSKLSPRAKLGLNLGPSPNHARHVNMVLNLSTGVVSHPIQFESGASYDEENANHTSHQNPAKASEGYTT